jgi:hypothetical protein
MQIIIPYLTNLTQPFSNSSKVQFQFSVQQNNAQKMFTWQLENVLY